MSVYCRIVPFHAPTALGARYTRFVALLVNGRAMRKIRIPTLGGVIVIREDMTTLEKGVAVVFKRFNVAVPLRKVDNKIIGRKLFVVIQLFKPLLQNVKGFCVDEKRYIGVVVANISIEFQVLHVLQFSACMESEIFNNVLLAVFLNAAAYFLGTLTHEQCVSRPRRDNRIMVKQGATDCIASALTIFAVFSTRPDNVCQHFPV